MKAQNARRDWVSLAVVLSLSVVAVPCLTGCQGDKAASSTGSNSEASLRQQMEHRPTDSEVQTALSKAPPDIRAMLEAQMKAGQSRQQPVAPTKVGGGSTSK